MIITIENLNKSYGDKVVFDNLSLTLDIENTVAIMGESGSGKTTLLRVISNLETADSGKISGAPERVSYMFQEDRLLPWLSAIENVKLVSDEETAKKYLSLVGLENEMNTMPDEMSGGMQRRVSLSRALSFKSELIILDEPFKGIDDALKKELINVIKSEKRPIIIITHDKSEALAMTDKILYFEGLPFTQVTS